MMALRLSVSLLTGCNNDKYQENEMQQQNTEPDPGSQQQANQTDPTTDGKQTGEGGALVNPQIGGYETTPAQTITENAESTTDLSSFISAVRTAGLVKTLNGTGPYTVFAPSNEAFKALPEGTLEDLMKPENKKRLTELLNNHIVAGKLDAAALQSSSSVKTLGNSQLQVSKQGEAIMVNGAEIGKENIPSSNGVVHIIDKVLVTENK